VCMYVCMYVCMCVCVCVYCFHTILHMLILNGSLVIVKKSNGIQRYVLYIASMLMVCVLQKKFITKICIFLKSPDVYVISRSNNQLC
jgi:hypothetical protein